MIEVFWLNGITEEYSKLQFRVRHRSVLTTSGHYPKELHQSESYTEGTLIVGASSFALKLEDRTMLVPFALLDSILTLIVGED